MNYKALNLNQRKKINGICNTSYHFEWEDDNFMEYLIGKLPEIRYNDYSNKEISEDNKEIINRKIRALKKMLDDYNAFWSDEEKTVFISGIEKLVNDIHKVKKAWYGIDLYRIRECIDMHKSCLILGYGGIGKSYFIKSFEEKLAEESIDHLCIYGKFVKDMQDIDVEEIISSANNYGFVFVVDAINEMSEEGQKELLEILEKMSKNSKIHIVITCRINSMKNNLLDKFRKIIKYEYTFPGVSFESALSELLKLPIPDIYLYEDILYSNNAPFFNYSTKSFENAKSCR